MKEITLSFTPDELRELAKQLYLAGYFLITCDYDNQAMVDDIVTRVCGTGFVEAPETGAFTHGGPTETLFTISREVYEECGPLIELFEADALKEHLPYGLAYRDFVEQYGFLEDKAVLGDPALFDALKALQAKYIKEFETYGVMHLRLEETK
jgi:hypothetical protein